MELRILNFLDLDIWGTNVYPGDKVLVLLFSDYTAKSNKPLWISEFGIDAWSVTNAAGINDWGLTLPSDLGGTGIYDPTTQSTWDGDLLEMKSLIILIWGHWWISDGIFR